ncbi:MAG: hypothetical protein LBE50_00770, partial [Gallionellaceae bacterium]|nr:hypothetical protein [Gallionellaceae bacterium]
RAEIETHDDTPYVFLDLDEHARRAGLKTRSTDSDATPLLLHLLASKPPRAHYANAEHTRNFRLRRYARAFYVAGIAALALSLASGASDLIEAGRLNDASQQTRERNARLSPPAPITLPAPAAEMKEAVTLWQTAAPSAATPQTLLSALSETLLEQPTIQLERLSWETATQSIALEINLTPEPASYHQALKQVEGFRQRLSQHQYDARTLPPAEDAAEKRPLRFSLRLQYKETP